MSSATQMILIALGDKVEAIKAAMSVMSDGIEWRMAKHELAEYEALLNQTARQALAA
jgi:hypothetical protein